MPTASWILAELRARPLPYAYLLVATLVMMTVLGSIVGRKEDLLGRLSTTDPLTGLANRRRLRAAFADELNRAARYETPLSLLLIDLDRLKDINDRHGHADGDRALQLVAEALRRSCRATDLAARYGGDEFVVLAVNTPAKEARVLALRIRDSVRRLSLPRGALDQDQRADQSHRVDRRCRPEGRRAADLRRAARRRRPGPLRGESRRPRRCHGRAAAPAPAEPDPRRGRPRRLAPSSRDQTTYDADQLLGRARLAEVVIPQPVVGW